MGIRIPIFAGHFALQKPWTAVVLSVVKAALRLQRLTRRTLAVAACLIASVVAPKVADGSQGTTAKLVAGGGKRVYGRFVAGPRGAVFSLDGASSVSLAPGTEATVMRTPQMLALSSGRMTPTYSVFLRQGRVDLKSPLKRADTAAVVVAAPRHVRVFSRSGESSVLATSDSVLVAVRTGSVAATQKTRSSDVTPGHVRVYSSAAPPSERTMLPAPGWLGGRFLWAALRESVRIKSLAWKPVPGAKGYRVVVSRAGSDQPLVEAETAQPRVLGAIAALEPGSYRVSVAATDADDITSNQSISRDLRVVGVELPGGAWVTDEGTISMGEDQELQLTHAEGLSVAKSGVTRRTDAKLPIKLDGRQPTNVYIYSSPHGSPAVLRLEPRRALVTAWTGPKLAEWPDVPIELRIRLQDAKGHALPSDIEPTARVLVGIDPVEVTWTKTGSTWTAELPPRTGPGPWVVRLEVVDQYGVLIGRDFVEVIRRLPRLMVASARGPLPAISSQASSRAR